jgi:hypothetical protein
LITMKKIAYLMLFAMRISAGVVESVQNQALI